MRNLLAKANPGQDSATVTSSSSSFSPPPPPPRRFLDPSRITVWGVKEWVSGMGGVLNSLNSRTEWAFYLAFPSLSEPKTRGASNPSQENRVRLKVAARGGLGE